MSGLEVVIGLVLGAISIAISACEHWRGVAEKYGRISSFEKQYRKIIEDLKDEQVIFRLQVERLLAPLVTGEIVQEGDLERLVENTQDPLWADEDITCAIMKRLGKAYENYVRVLADIESDCMRLLKSLGFDKPEVVSEPSTPLLDQHLRCTLSLTCCNGSARPDLWQEGISIRDPQMRPFADYVERERSSIADYDAKAHGQHAQCFRQLQSPI